MSKQRLEAAPGFDKDDWPTPDDRAWLVEVDEFYGYEPYWR